MRRTTVQLIGSLAVVAVLALGGCANLIHKNELQASARAALSDAGLTAGAEAFDTGEGFADRYDLLICVTVPAGQEDDNRGQAQAIVDALNAVREVAHGNGGRVNSVSIRLTDTFTDRQSLNKWCRSDARLLVMSSDALGMVSIAPARSEFKVVDFEVPYPKVKLLVP